MSPKVSFIVFSTHFILIVLVVDISNCIIFIVLWCCVDDRFLIELTRCYLHLRFDERQCNIASVTFAICRKSLAIVILVQIKCEPEHVNLGKGIIC